MGSLSLLQRTFPTQGSNPGLPHCRQILYQLSQKGSPRILEWVKVKVAQLCPTLCDPIQFLESRPEYWSGYPFPSPGDLPNSGIKHRSPALQADSLLTELQGKPLICVCMCVCKNMGFPGGSMVKHPPANTGEAGSTPGLGRYSGERKGNLL